MGRPLREGSRIVRDGEYAQATGKVLYKIVETTLTKGGGRNAAIAITGALKHLPGGRAPGCSFAGDVAVLMADGTTKAISEIQPGDEVLATDPETDEQGPREVQATHVHDDILITLVVDGHEIRTTEDHPFWSATDQKFERADELGVGEQVLTADGETATVTAIRYDVTYEPASNLTVEGLHTYHVLTDGDRGPPADAESVGGTVTGAPLGILVHNCGRAETHAALTISAAQDGRRTTASNYHGHLTPERELSILANPDAAYHSSGGAGNFIFRQGDDVVVTRGPGAGRGSVITRYGPSGPRNASGAAALGGSPNDPGLPVTHDMIVNGRVSKPSGGFMPAAVQITPCGCR